MESHQRQTVMQRIADLGTPSRSYFLLLLLSTVIATFGLLADSAATVIGAMIVAPLMGPILGLALGLVRGDEAQAARALLAEVGGVLAVIATACSVAFLVTPEAIDYNQHEIAARTQPTLYDLAIGFAAGLAGAYCLVNPRLEAGVAGVAIAVALVPPLAVTGLTLAGAYLGRVGWEAPFGSAVLFLANFLTIEFAAVVIFVAHGLGAWRSLQYRMVRVQLLVTLGLLLVTGWFLSNQLQGLLQQRFELSAAREILSEGLRGIPGAWLEDIAVRKTAEGTQFVAEVASRQNVSPTQVARLEKELSRALTRPLTLVLRLVRTEYVSGDGLLYEPRPSPDPQATRLRRLEEALRSSAAEFTGVQLSDFQVQNGLLQVSVRSPYPLGPELVADWQSRLRQLVEEPDLNMRVTSTVATVATAERTVVFDAPVTEKAGPDLALLAADQRIRTWASAWGTVEELQLEAPTEARQAYSVRLQVAGPRPIPERQVRAWQRQIQELLPAAEDSPAAVRLQVKFRQGADLVLPETQPSPPSGPSPSQSQP
jgi:uncharacterized hydrophobic protein (TIGR00271 family)